MAILLYVCMILVTVVVGGGILTVLYGKKQESTFLFADALLLGAIAVVGTAGAAHICAVAAKLSFSAAVWIFSGLTTVLFLVALTIIFFNYYRVGRNAGRKQENHLMASRGLSEKLSSLSVFFMLLVLCQAIYITFGGGVYLGGDMTVETVESFFYTDGIYRVNPMTGAAYQEGLPLRVEILCLPTLYGALSRLSGLSPRVVVWTVVPLMTILLSYSAFFCLGRCLFPTDRKKREIFLTAIALLLWAGGYHYVVDGFGALYSGFRGTVIRNVVLIPYLLSLCLRRRWLAALLCIAAEGCIVWTLYGAGVCLLSVAVMAVCMFAERRLEGSRREETGT